MAANLSVGEGHVSLIIGMNLIIHQRTIPSGTALLAGELSLPADVAEAPTVLMIHGSGPLDRNENTRGMSLNIFNVLAEQLASRQLASFRYDKRGCGNSTGDFFRTGHADLVADASACIDWISQQKQCDPHRIIVLGHSEGTIIAAQLAARYPNLAGLVLICPFVEPMDSILRRQARKMRDELSQAKGIHRLLYACVFAMLGDPIQSQEKLLAKLKATTEPSFRLMLQKVNAKWLRELIALDCEEIYSEVRVPILAIAGEKDIQCLPSDVVRIGELAPCGVTQQIVADLTHLLRLDMGEPSFLGYRKLLKQPMDPSIGQRISDWIGQL